MPNGTGDGTENPQGNEGGASALSEAQLQQVNKAISARFGDFEKKFTTKLSEQLKSSTEELGKTLLEQLKPSESQNQGENDGKGKLSPELAAMQKRLEEAEQRTKRIEQERDAERLKRRDVSMRDTVKRMLADKGFTDPKRLELAVGHLVDTAKAVRFDADDDSRVLVTLDGQDLPLSEGIEQFAKSDTGKFFLPPKGAGGSGDFSNNSGRRTGDGNPTRAELGAAIMGFVDE